MSKDIDPIDIKGKVGPPKQSAGRFSFWLRETRSALVNENGAEVPCGQCRACCQSSYFIHIRPEETNTLARIPKKLLTPAPGSPKGHMMMGHYANGDCPMLIGSKCSIYEDRPLTCRAYDCRVFTAAGIKTVGGEGTERLDRQIRRWKFSYPTQRDRCRHAAARAAARFLRMHPGCLPRGGPKNSTQLAVLAIQSYTAFLRYYEKPSKVRRVPSDHEIAHQVKRQVKKAIEKYELRRAR